jgi:hypothetical protein
VEKSNFAGRRREASSAQEMDDKIGVPRGSGDNGTNQIGGELRKGVVEKSGGHPSLWGNARHD